MALNAIQAGRLVRQPCQECGEVRSEAHHEDYSKPLEVIWLCKPHHREADARLGFGPTHRKATPPFFLRTSPRQRPRRADTMEGSS